MQYGLYEKGESDCAAVGEEDENEVNSIPGGE
jgi:hypothetical protein